MEKTNTCPISDEPAEALPQTGGYHEFDCPSCGRFRISDTALEQIQAMSRREREALLSEAKRDVQGGEGLPFIRNID
jgi:hypothetical protein